MKSYRSSLTLVSVDLLFGELLQAVLYGNLRRDIGCRFEFVGTGGGPVLLK